METLRVFTAFSGYDSQCMALERLGIGYDLVGWSEVSLNAIRAHDAVFPQYKDRNFGDISKIDWGRVPDFDLFTYSFPCTDVSLVGRRKGLKEGGGTKSGLLWECKKAIGQKRPKFLLMENVKGLVSQKFLPDLLKWDEFLTEMGYTSFIQVLNAKHYGIPQNRERVFVVSIHGSAWYDFPKPFGLRTKLPDMLEAGVDSWYYRNPKKLKRELRFFEIDEPCALTVKRSEYGRGIRAAYEAGEVKEKRRNMEILCPRTDGIANTLTTRPEDNLIIEPLREDGRLRVRLCTPRECFRLMDVSDTDIDKIQAAGISASQQYMLAGNSIVVDVLCHIFKNLFEIGGENED